MVRMAGLALTLAYATFILWLYAAQPQTVAQVSGRMASGIGAYRVDPQATSDGKAFLYRDQHPEARAAFERADPAHLDARTQFYIAYSYYRQGWGPLYHDNRLYAEGLIVIDRAITIAESGRLVVADPDLAMHTAEELKAELEAGMRLDPSDLNPMRLFGVRK